MKERKVTYALKQTNRQTNKNKNMPITYNVKKIKLRAGLTCLPHGKKAHFLPLKAKRGGN